MFVANFCLLVVCYFSLIINYFSFLFFRLHLLLFFIKGATKLKTKKKFFRHKNRQKHNQHFKLLFFKINLHFMSNQISTYRKLNLPLPRSIYLVFLPLEMQRRLKQSKVYHMFFYCLKRYNPESFKSGRSKNPFLQCVFYWYNLLR